MQEKIGFGERRAYQKIADVFEQCSYEYAGLDNGSKKDILSKL